MVAAGAATSQVAIRQARVQVESVHPTVVAVVVLWRVAISYALGQVASA